MYSIRILGGMCKPLLNVLSIWDSMLLTTRPNKTGGTVERATDIESRQEHEEGHKRQVVVTHYLLYTNTTTPHQHNKQAQQIN